MRVRIRKSERTEYWYIQIKYWWWPFWICRTFELNKEEALQRASQVKRPIVEEIE